MAQKQVSRTAPEHVTDSRGQITYRHMCGYTLHVSHTMINIALPFLPYMYMTGNHTENVICLPFLAIINTA